MISHDIPTRPWQKVATDLFQSENRHFIITVDYYSRFFEIDELYTTTSAAVIRKLSCHFARYGIPETVISDNGPQFSSIGFEDFAEIWDFKHTTSTPGYPQSNGLAESTVQTAKKILSKAHEDTKSPLLAILEYRNTPVDGMKSPAELIFGRQLRSILPTIQQHLRQKEINPSAVMARRKYQQLQQKKYYDRNAKPLQPLQTNDKVYLQLTGEKWQPAKITNTGENPRSYIVETDNGNTYRRNRRFLRPKPTTPEPPTSSETPSQTSLQCQTSAEPNMTTWTGRVVKPPRRFDL